MKKKIGTLYLPMIAHSWMKQRPQHMMECFARLGHKSAFITPQNRGVKEVDGTKELEQNFFLCSDLPNALEVLKDCDEIWMYTTWFMHQKYEKLIPNLKIIYDICDHIPFLSNYVGNEDKHDWMMKNSEVVVGTAKTLMEEYQSEREDMIYVPNGVVVEDFNIKEHRVLSDMERIKETGKPIVGYYGALAKWFDFELYIEVAKSRPEYEFVLIGCDYDGTLRKHILPNNMHYLGLKKYEDLPHYLNYFDVATIPFKVNEITKATSPVKMFEYMAGQKPIISTPLRECMNYDVIRIGEDARLFAAQLDLALKEKDNEDFKEKLLASARNNSWIERAIVIENLMLSEK